MVCLAMTEGQSFYFKFTVTFECKGITASGGLSLSFTPCTLFVYLNWVWNRFDLHCPPPPIQFIIHMA